MLVPLDYLGRVHGDAAAARARDAYLSGFGEPAALRPTLELARRVARIARALTWVRALEAGGDADPSWVAAPAETLKQLLRSQTGA
jgi:hypothetical protein